MTTPNERSRAYLAINRANWDERAPIHAASPDYGADRSARDRGRSDFLVGLVAISTANPT